MIASLSADVGGNNFTLLQRTELRLQPRPIGRDLYSQDSILPDDRGLNDSGTVETGCRVPFVTGFVLRDTEGDDGAFGDGRSDERPVASFYRQINTNVHWLFRIKEDLVSGEYGHRRFGMRERMGHVLSHMSWELTET